MPAEDEEERLRHSCPGASQRCYYQCLAAWLRRCLFNTWTLLLCRAGAAKRPPKSAEDAEREHQNRLWLGGVAAALAAYVLFSGSLLGIAAEEGSAEYEAGVGFYEEDE